MPERNLMDDLVKIWYVSSERLCNFHCHYCVSINEYAKSSTVEWLNEDDRLTFESIVRWMGTRRFHVGVRLGTLGEPFASKTFLTQAAWLTRQKTVLFVELLTNGSLLKSRLPRLAQEADLSKVSLWITYHDSQMSIERFVENAVFAQEQYGCFVVVNGLLFPENGPRIEELRSAAAAARLRFNLDLGYEAMAPSSDGSWGSGVIPLLQVPGGVDAAVSLGARRDLLAVNLAALDRPHGLPCGAGHKYVYIGIDGDAYRCSRYYVLKKERLGNVLDPEFELNLGSPEWEECQAQSGCCNKEDFLNLKMWRGRHASEAPSLGWVGT
jgi:MoaA/NifB/PqqE/SkfB family radical SAM enzyme